MQNGTPQNGNPPPAANGGWASDGFKKQLPTIVLAAIAGFASSWWSSQQSLSELRYTAVTNKEAIAQNAANIKSNADGLQQIILSVSRISDTQARVVEDLKQLQADQRYNNSQMNKR